jgi:peptidoglycan/LPS O-acetylase OafA/YrhL
MFTHAPRYYRPELDALRFFAFLSVFFFHGMEYFVPDAFRDLETFHLAWAGQWGVPLFFFLSAFLIVELLLRERDTFSSIRLGAFYIRRILRIWPLYFAAYWGFALLEHWIPNVNPHAGTTWPWFTIFLANWYISHHGWIAGPVDPLWSISVEEQFYLFVPMITALGGRRALRVVSLIVIAVSYYEIYRYARVTWHGDSGAWTNSLVQFQFFAGGALLAMGLKGHVPQWSSAVRALVFGAGVVCWVMAQTVFRVRGWMCFATVPQALAGWPLILLGCALFLLAFLGIDRERIPRFAVYLGRISYGLYVIHSLFYLLVFHYVGAAIARHLGIRPYPLPQAIVWPLIAFALGVSILFAHLSYRYFERPFLRLKEKFALVPSRPE